MVVVGGIAAQESKRSSENGHATGQHDQIVAHVERDVDLLALFRSRLELLVAHALC